MGVSQNTHVPEDEWFAVLALGAPKGSPFREKSTSPARILQVYPEPRATDTWTRAVPDDGRHERPAILPQSSEALLKEAAHDSLVFLSQGLQRNVGIPPPSPPGFGCFPKVAAYHKLSPQLN